MNAHVLMVLYTGITFVSAGACLLEIARQAACRRPIAQPPSNVGAPWCRFDAPPSSS